MMKYHLLIYLCLVPILCFGQDFQLGSNQNLLAEPFSISGNFGVNFRSYKAWDIDNRQYPYATSVTANAVIKSYDVKIPISFVMHNLNDTGSPFNKEYWEGFMTNQRNRLTRFGASPEYKWIKVHLGHRYMNFSQFTLANHNFLGGGFELTPNKWKIAAMYGRLTKAEPQSKSLNTYNVQQYTRKGWGFKLGYWDNPKDYIELSLFYAKDDLDSLMAIEDSIFLVTPQENLAISLNAKKAITNTLSLKVEIAKSALTRNAGDEQYDKGFALYNSFIFKRKSSTTFSNAAEVKLEYQKKELQLGVTYRRIDPDYRSLGAYFFNDDLEDITASARFKLFKRKVNFLLTGGIRRNNLDKVKDASFLRLIGSAVMTYQLDDWNFSANYTNYSSKVDYILNSDLDSLNAVIVSEEASFIINRVIPGNGASFQSINFIAGLQTVNDNVDNPQHSVASNLFFINTSYAISTRSHWQYSVTADFNTNQLNTPSIAKETFNRYGAGMQVAKGFDNNKYRLGLGMNYYLQTGAENTENHLWSNFVTGSWKVTKRQTLNLQLNWLRNNRAQGVGSNKFSELMGSISYNITFDYSAARKARKNQL